MKSIREFNRELFLIEERFFEFDKTKNTVRFYLEYERPSEIFENNARTMTPMITGDFLEAISGAFSLIPNKYKVDIDVAFDDLEGWSEAELSDICRKNLCLRAKVYHRRAQSHNRLAAYMCLTGMVFIVLSVMLGRIWDDSSFLNGFVTYVLDIIATVPFWCAMEIYFIDNKENRIQAINLMRRYGGISCHRKAR